jgi:hypothetical protein
VWSEEAIIWFTAFYALLGIMIMSAGLSIVAAEIIAAHEAATEAAKRKGTPVEFKRQQSVLVPSFLEKYLPEAVLRLLPTVILLFVVIIIGMIMIILDTGGDISLGRAFYFAVITGTTIGYGDISPSTAAGRGFSILYILLTVVATGNVLSSIASAIIDAKKKAILDKILAKKITREDFQKFDVDGDGTIERTEYIMRKLMLMGLLNADDVKRVEAEFNSMDADKSGEITMEDLDAFLSHQQNSANEDKG